MQFDNGTLLTIAIQLAVWVFSAGMLWSKVSNQGKELNDLRAEVRDFAGIKEDLAVLKTKLEMLVNAFNKIIDKQLVG